MCTIELNNIGCRALTSHLKSKKHVYITQNKDSQGGLLKTWIQSSKSTCSSDNNKHVTLTTNNLRTPNYFKLEQNPHYCLILKQNNEHLHTNDLKSLHAFHSLTLAGAPGEC